MDTLEKLNDWSVRQERLAAELRELLSRTAGSETLQELQRLRTENDSLRLEVQRQDTELKKLSVEVSSLRQALYDQILDERLQILKISSRRTGLFFRKGMDEAGDSLSRLEATARERLTDLKKRTQRELGEDGESLRKELDRLESVLNEALRTRRETFLEGEKALAAEIHAARGDLGAEPLSEEVIRQRVRQNRLEMKIGTGWLGRSGIFLIVVAVALFAWYVRDHISAFAKSAVIFAGGLSMLAAGEILYRKKKAPFHKLFLGGGIAILFLGVFFSHFLLKAGGLPVMDTLTAMGFSVGISLTALVLSLRYSSRTIIVFAAVGGYLPFLTYLIQYGFSGNGYTWAMVYLTLLNCLVLAAGLFKEWRITTWLLFFLNAPSVSFLVLSSPSPAVGLVFTVVTFSLYAFAVFARPIFRKKGLGAVDLILLGFNTTVSAVVLWFLFRKLGWLDYDGFLALGMALLYAAGALLVTRFRPEEKTSALMLFLTAVTFSVLVIPFQFGAVWLTLGWLVQAVLLILFGFKRSIRWASVSGWILMGICVFAFVAVDLFAGLAEPDRYRPVFGFIPLFDLKYLSLTLSLAALSLFFSEEVNAGRLSRFSRYGKFLEVVRIVSQVNLIPFVLFLVISWYHRFVMEEEFFSVSLPAWAAWLGLFGAASLALRGTGLLVSRLKPWRDRVSSWLGTAMLLVADLLTVIVTFPRALLPLNEPGEVVLKGFGLALLILLNLGILYDARRLLYLHFRSTGRQLELFPMILVLLAAGLSTVLLLCHLSGSTVSLVLAVVWLMIAVTGIVYGFVRRFVFVRFAGLGLIASALVILFVNIFRSVSIPGKILAFLVFGATLIALSFGYHRISRTVNSFPDTSKKKEPSRD